jgi:hypothetical protein
MALTWQAVVCFAQGLKSCPATEAGSQPCCRPPEKNAEKVLGLIKFRKSTLSSFSMMFNVFYFCAAR